ncbi:MAG TPA: tRNA pseudouridine(55) synthase TruB [Candidatus Limnocylindrales bacterium]|nr:tRNA pseudouridine(55) synthase TruB [Candidatus Limnocylindrales bacterium]
MARSSLGPGLDGILVVDKPIGPSSHDIVGLVRRLAATKRVGHGGTLDPFASGVLPVFLGRATRVVEFHLADRKAYRATICFGASSTTDDLEGELTPSDGPAPTREVVETALPMFTGPISQRPPAYSAIKIGGRRAYAMARAGETVELKERDVTIDSFTIVAWDDSDPERPIAVVDVTCSAGTYVRALARDLGTAVGSAAYLGALRRTAAGSFEEEAAVTLDAVRTATADGPEGLVPLLRPIDAGLDRFPRVELDEREVDSVAQGQYVKPAAGIPANADHYRLVDQTGRLVAIAIPAGGGRLAPDKVLVSSGERPISVGA